MSGSDPQALLESLAQLRASLLRDAPRWTDDQLAEVQYAATEAAGTAEAIRSSRALGGR